MRDIVKGFLKGESKVYYFCIWSFMVLIIKAMNPDSDMYFLAATGRYIIKSGIPRINPFCIDEGFKIIVQQWSGAVLDYFILDRLGAFAFYIVAIIYMTMALWSIFRYFAPFAESRVAMFLTMSFSAILLKGFCNTRGSVVSAAVLITMLRHLMDYEKDYDRRHLLVLPLTGLFIINWQAAFFPLLFVYTLPFLMPGKAKGLIYDTAKSYKKEWEYYKGVLIAAFLMFLSGFINPYGIDGMLYLIKSRGVLTDYVTEFKKMAVTDSFSLYIVLIIISVTVCVIKQGGDINFRHLCLYCGAVIISVAILRNVWHLVVAMPAVITMLNGLAKMPICNTFRELLLKRNKWQRLLFPVIAGLISVMMLVISFFVGYSRYDGTVDCEVTPVGAVNYLSAFDKDSLRIMSGFNNGGFLEWNGYKVLLDARPEVYNKHINGKRNLYDDYCDAISRDNDCTGAFLSEYDFTHIIAMENTGFYYYLCDRADYKIVVDCKRGVGGYALFEKCGWRG